MQNIILLLTSFDGRISRSRFWLGIACLVIVALVLAMILGTFTVGVWEPNVVSAVGSLIMLYPAIAIGVKRLHDRSKAAIPWAIILFGPSILMQLTQFTGWGWEIIPMEGSGMAQAMPTSPLTIGLAVISVIVGLWALIELGFLKGTEGPNQFGPDPLEGR